jgi:methionyl-tRNA formyltransferase
VQAFAEQHGLSVHTPTSLRDDAVLAGFAAHQADIAVVAAYGLILPAAFLHLPRLGCVNAHASLLPRWRGAAPIQRAIEAGDRQTGITIMQMEAGLDTGPMLLSESLDISSTSTAGALEEQLAGLAARLMPTALSGLADGRLSPVPQPESGVCYAAKVRKDEGWIDWTQSAATVARRIRAFTPAPGASFDHAGERFKVLAAEAVTWPPGTASGIVLDERLTVACGEGAVRITVLQRAGRAPMATEALLRGFAIPPKTQLACRATN